MIFKVGLWGATGKMGLEVAALLAPGFRLERADREPVNLELSDAVAANSRFSSVEGIEVRHPDDPPRENVHVWIDFSRPEGTLALLKTAKVPVVVATTGFTPEQRRAVEAAAQRIPILISANFSPGIAWVQKVLRQNPRQAFAAPEALTVYVEEEHHRHKPDAPSGTAKTLIETLRTQGIENVPANSIRAGDIVGVHTVRLLTDGEEIAITHRVTDRRIFARGAIVAAAFLARGRAPGLYDFEAAL